MHKNSHQFFKNLRLGQKLIQKVDFLRNSTRQFYRDGSGKDRKVNCLQKNWR